MLVSASDLTHRLATGHVNIGKETGTLVIKDLQGAPDAPVLIAAYVELLRLQGVQVQRYDFTWEEETEEKDEKVPGRWKVADFYGPLYTAVMLEEKMWKMYDVHNVSIQFCLGFTLVHRFLFFQILCRKRSRSLIMVI